MNRARCFWSLVLPALLVISSVAPSWGWVRWGFGGPRVGVYLGAGPWWYDPYYYDPYYAGGPYYYPNSYYPYNPGYAPAPEPADSSSQEALPPSPDNARHDLRFLNSQIARARDQVDYEFDDGDISRAEHTAEIHRLAQITIAAHAAAKANGGALTADQEDVFLRQLRGEEVPVGEYSGTDATSQGPAANSDRSLQKVEGEISRLRASLDKKLAAGDITKAQQEGMSRYLDRLDQHIHADGAANGGGLTPDEESAALQQLQRVGESITQNFIEP